MCYYEQGDEKITFDRNEERLEISINSELKNDLPICFKIEIG
jgi:hypothetical protein